MRSYEIWQEGGFANGEPWTAQQLAKGIEAGSFEHACDLYFLYADLVEDYDPDQMTFWGCKLFDNEEDARKSFG